MAFSPDDTIAAIATPSGGAARGVIRLSGPAAIGCAAAIAAPFEADRLVVAGAPTVTIAALRPPGFTTPLPCDLYCWPSGRSYTGQSVVELHTVGSPPVLQAALEALLAAGARLAEPGEFTLRAFLSGRLDLVQAEAVLGVIDAASPRHLEVALAQLAGGLAGPLSRLREDLLDALSRLEAELDFPDEGLPTFDSAPLRRCLTAAAVEIQTLLRQMEARLDTNVSPRAALVGPPNSGKSSLFNALAGRRAALTSHLPGTTRDYLTVELDLDGFRCQLVDTAGVEPVAESAGVAFAAQQATAEQTQQADLRIVCIDAARPLWESGPNLLAISPPNALLVYTKIDLAPPPPDAALAVSSVTGQGLDALRRDMRRRLAQDAGPALGVVPDTAARCRQSLQSAAECLLRAGGLLESGAGEELLAAELRVALAELGRVTGAVYADDVLDRIFSRFCIGK